MSRKTTLILLAILILMSALAYLTEHPRGGPSPAAPRRASAGATVFAVRTEDILKVRVKRDYWNTFTLARGPDGSWRLVEPSDEPALDAPVRKLLAALETLPAVSVIDLPADDAERHRQYGLWTPTVEVTVSTGDGNQALLVGTPTPDGKGVYCARVGQDKVYVTSAEAMQALSQDLAAYRQGGGSPQP